MKFQCSQPMNDPQRQCGATGRIATLEPWNGQGSFNRNPGADCDRRELRGWVSLGLRRDARRATINPRLLAYESTHSLRGEAYRRSTRIPPASAVNAVR